MPGLRIALYSHDAMGLGHVRRNLLLARALCNGSVRATVLLICGAHEAGALEMPDRVDCLALPALRKRENGDYATRRLDLPRDSLVQLRGQTIAAALRSYSPDVLIVDKVPLGLDGELRLGLDALPAGTRCILGLRDILDDADRVIQDWKANAVDEAIARYYHAVWVYGDPAVFDPVVEYRLAGATADKVRYTGYLDPAKRDRAAIASHPDQRAALQLREGPIALCMVGGGEDGGALAGTFADAFTAPGLLPTELSGVLLTGPFMPAGARQALHRQAASCPRLRVLEFTPEPAALLTLAHRVVTMGGYNTVCEVLSAGKPALVVPRVEPRREQLIRATRLSKLGFLDVLRPEHLSPQGIAHWIMEPRPAAPAPALDFGGLSRIPAMVAELLNRADAPRSAHAIG